MALVSLSHLRDVLYESITLGEIRVGLGASGRAIGETGYSLCPSSI